MAPTKIVQPGHLADGLRIAVGGSEVEILQSGAAQQRGVVFYVHDEELQIDQLFQVRQGGQVSDARIRQAEALGGKVFAHRQRHSGAVV